MSERGQTTLDFALGVSLFAAVLLFVFVFVPGLLAPFTGGVNEETVSSNRVVDGIVAGNLGTPAEPGRLDGACTAWFFEHAGGPTESSPASCGYDGGTVQERLGLDDHQSVNVTISGNVSTSGSGSSTLCRNSGGGLAEVGSGRCTGSDDVVLRAGASPPVRNDDAISAVRVAALGTEDVTVTVELW